MFFNSLGNILGKALIEPLINLALYDVDKVAHNKKGCLLVDNLLVTPSGFKPETLPDGRQASDP